MLTSIYIQNKYLFWYNSIILSSHSQNRIKHQGVYYEQHHIIPKSLGGMDVDANLVLLTAKEHFICHRLLTKFTTGQNKQKMNHAIWRMVNCSRQSQTITSKVYENLKINISDYMKENNPMSNVKTVNKMKLTVKNRPQEKQKLISDKFRKISTGRKLSKKSKNKLSLFWKGKSRPKTNIHIKKHKKSIQKYIYHTPYGDFISSNEGVNKCGVSNITIHNRCVKNSNIKPRGYDSTWKEMGWYSTRV